MTRLVPRSNGSWSPERETPKKLAALKHTLKTTDPFELSTRIDQQLQRIYKLASHADRAPTRETTAETNAVEKLDLQQENYSAKQQDMKRQMRDDFG